MAPSISSDELDYYYQSCFPFRTAFQWLNHSAVPSTDFANREFAFTLPEGQYLRYQSFASSEEWKQRVLQIKPQRFEIGAIFNSRPKDQKLLSQSSRQGYLPQSKELVFDIDLTDYDQLRTCCSGKKTCSKCWQFITVAMDVLDRCFREDFGFEHILWVFSGRRGVHAWVCDPSARQLNDQQRKALVDYLAVVGRIERGKEIVNIPRPMHPHIQRSFNILKRRFETNILVDQDPWRSQENASKLLDLLAMPPLVEALKKKWFRNTNESLNEEPSTKRWADIDSVASKLPKNTKGFDSQQLLETKQNIIMEYMYPRLDVNVSRARNHLLKSPFCVHPDTGNISVPIDPKFSAEFDPTEVPTLVNLLQELENNTSNDGNDGKDGSDKRPAWERTSLAPYIHYFKTFVNGLNRPEKRAADSIDF